ncbi:GNAT family N-acetyltransferase [Aquimarina algiphila]|uniref:GNAT family N-acetyltransferase n=1 Tax=Aquimarina algiphila TaxID=2047982 RepID=A0A554VAS5_9FLAO|nr:GNAT family N-acetyltransferase [Aquimarina algiphila]TSE03369.1 GNAT family N-acetyltransferase [Aquimarina algiphila]
MKSTTFPELYTKRLLLRRLKESDAVNIQFLRSHDAVNTFIKRAKTDTIEEAITFITNINTKIDNNDILFWSITENNSSELIGTICLWNFSEDRKIAEVGYDLHPNFQGRGIMSEALSCILHYGFEQLRLDQIEAFTHRENIPSKKLLTRHNFILMKERKDEGNLDNIIFSKSRN